MLSSLLALSRAYFDVNHRIDVLAVGSVSCQGEKVVTQSVGDKKIKLCDQTFKM